MRRRLGAVSFAGARLVVLGFVTFLATFGLTPSALAASLGLLLVTRQRWGRVHGKARRWVGVAFDLEPPVPRFVSAG